MVRPRFLTGLAFALLTITAAGCRPPRSAPDLASPPYPADLHTANSVDVQVFRENQALQIVNTTAMSYEDFTLWLNQRYARRVKSLLAGATVRLSLWEFYDELGEGLTPGGFWRTERATPIRMCEIQVDDETPLIGLITIRAEDPVQE